MEGITGSPWFPTLFGYGRGVLGAVGEVDGDNSVIREALTLMDRQGWSAPECNVRQAPRILLYSSESTPQLRNTSTGKSAGGQPGPVEKLIPGYQTRLRCRVEPIRVCATVAGLAARCHSAHARITAVGRGFMPLEWGQVVLRCNRGCCRGAAVVDDEPQSVPATVGVHMQGHKFRSRTATRPSQRARACQPILHTAAGIHDEFMTRSQPTAVGLTVA